MSDTSLITAERFRMPVGGGWILGILGGGFVVLSAAFLVVALQAPVFERVQLYVAAFPLLVGGVMIGAAIQRSRFSLTIAPEGVRFTSAGELVPWSSIARFTPSTIRNELRVHDQAGRVIGVVPAAIDGFERAVLRLAQVTTKNATRGPRSFVGHHGGWGWFFFIIAAVYVGEHMGFGRWPSFHGIQWVWGVVLVLFVLAELRQRWGGTGEVELTIDDLGIRFRGRSGDWEARWGEITEIIPHFKYPSRFGAMTLTVKTSGYDHHTLSIKEFDLVEVLGALRVHGESHWARSFVPPAEAPKVPLLQKKF